MTLRDWYCTTRESADTLLRAIHRSVMTDADAHSGGTLLLTSFTNRVEEEGIKKDSTESSFSIVTSTYKPRSLLFQT